MSNNCECNPGFLSSDSIKYDGPNTPCVNVRTCDTITVAIQKIDDKICQINASSIFLTTLGTSGPATYVDGILNIPQYNSFLGTVTYVSALNVTSSGTDITSSVEDPTTTPVITLNIPTASSTSRGALSASDWSTFNSKEPAIAAGTTAQYWRGDKSWQTLDTSVVPENTNLYFTNGRARAAISLTTIGSSGASTYDSNTGVFNIPVYTISGLGGEPAITPGTTLQYWRGDKTWQTLNTTNVIEATQLYFTDARARAAISLTTIGSSGSSTYDSVSGVLNVPTYTISGLGGEPTITSGTTSQYWRGDKTWQTLDTTAVTEASNLYFTTARSRASLSFSAGSGNYDSTTGVITIPTDNSQIGNGAGYITTISGITAGGELDGTYPNPTLKNAAVTGKVLSGLNLTGGGTITATDTILQAFGKVQNQISAIIGGVMYQGVWNATTNVPTLISSVGTKGHYYIVDVAGSTNLNGITDWKVGDWAIFNGSTWDKVDNTDAVSSVNGFTGAVSLTTSNINEGTNLYYTDTRARAAISVSGSLSYDQSTGVISYTQPVNVSTFTNDAGYITTAGARAAISLTTTGTSGAATYNSSTGVLNIPNYGSALSGYVPYTGATTNVNLGSNTITAGGGTLTGALNGTSGLFSGNFQLFTGSFFRGSNTGGSPINLAGVGFDNNIYLGDDGVASNIRVGNSAGYVRISSGGKTLINTTTDNGTDALQVAGRGYFSTGLLIGNNDGAYGTFVSGSSAASSYTIASIRNLNSGVAGGVQGSQLNFYGDVGYPSSAPTAYIRAISNDIENNGNGSLVFATHNGVSGTTTQKLKIDYLGRATFSSSVTANGTITSTNSGVDGNYIDAFIARYSTNVNETNAIQTAVSVGDGSGFRFQVSNGGGSSARTTVLTLIKSIASFTVPIGAPSGSFSGNVYAPSFSSGIVSITNNNGGLVLNRDAVTNFTGIYYQTAGSSRWFVGMRENLGENNYCIYNENGSYDAIRIASAGGAVRVNSSLTTGGALVSEAGLNVTANATTINANFLRTNLDGSTNVNTGLILGKAQSNNNAATFVYTHASDGSTANRVGIGFWGSDNLLNIAASGNVGVGVVPSAWNSSVKALQVSNGSIYASTTFAFFGSNIVWQNAGDRYISDGFATLYGQNSSGNHTWFTAPSASAGSVMSLGNPKMTLTNGGRLLLNTTTDNGLDILQVNGTTSTTFLKTFGDNIFNFADGSFTWRNNTANLLETHIRPNAGKSAYITFTENAVADRWSIGITAGDGSFYFRQPYSGSSVMFALSPTGNGTFAGRSRVNGIFLKGTSTGFDGNFDEILRYAANQDIDVLPNRWIGMDASITAGSSSANQLRFRVYRGGDAQDVAPYVALVLRGDRTATLDGSLRATAYGTNTYGINVSTDNASGNKDIFLAGVAGVSNGFTVNYFSSPNILQYQMLNGNFIVDGNGNNRAGRIIVYNYNSLEGGFGYSGLFKDLTSASNNYIPWSFENQHGNHSWGAVARFHINTTVGDRPSITFSHGGNNTRWSIGYVFPDDNFRITQNHGMRPDGSGGNDGWGTVRFLIDTAGAATFSSSVTATGFFESSDIRLKDVISRDGDVVYYRWKDKRDDRLHIGYVAQEVQIKNPNQVLVSIDGLLTVNYTEVLVEKVRTLEKRVDVLETENQTLKQALEHSGI